MKDSIISNLTILYNTLDEECRQSDFIKGKPYALWIKNILEYYIDVPEEKEGDIPELLLGEHEFPVEEVEE